MKSLTDKNVFSLHSTLLDSVTDLGFVAVQDRGVDVCVADFNRGSYGFDGFFRFGLEDAKTDAGDRVSGGELDARFEVGVG